MRDQTCFKDCGCVVYGVTTQRCDRHQERRASEVARFRDQLAFLLADEKTCAACATLRVEFAASPNGRYRVCDEHAEWRLPLIEDLKS